MERLLSVLTHAGFPSSAPDPTSSLPPPQAAHQGSPSGSRLCLNKLIWTHAWASCKYCNE